MLPRPLEASGPAAWCGRGWFLLEPEKGSAPGLSPASSVAGILGVPGLVDTLQTHYSSSASLFTWPPFVSVMSHRCLLIGTLGMLG